MLARAMQTGAKILLLYDPTRGVDVGTKQSIYAAIRRFAESGGAVLLYSSELPELVHLADRCLVVYGGRIFAQLIRRRHQRAHHGRRAHRPLDPRHRRMSANADAAAASAPGSNLGIAIRRGLTDGAGIVAILYVILFALYALWDPSALRSRA